MELVLHPVTSTTAPLAPADIHSDTFTPSSLSTDSILPSINSTTSSTTTFSSYPRKQPDYSANKHNTPLPSVTSASIQTDHLPTFSKRRLPGAANLLSRSLASQSPSYMNIAHPQSPGMVISRHQIQQPHNQWPRHSHQLYPAPIQAQYFHGFPQANIKHPEPLTSSTTTLLSDQHGPMSRVPWMEMLTDQVTRLQPDGVSRRPPLSPIEPSLLAPRQHTFGSPQNYQTPNASV
ncbi:unnamed protein product, partial [Protopolystoma xenopodis]